MQSNSPTMIAPGATIGILGGGQLEKMTALAASHLGYRTYILCPEGDNPAALVSNNIIRSHYDNKDNLSNFSNSSEVMTLCFENIDDAVVEALAKQGRIYPGAEIIRIAQHRLREKAYFREHGVQTADFYPVHSLAELETGVRSLPQGCGLLKSCRFGYDGKGQYKIDLGTDLAEIWAQAGFEEAVLEAWVPFKTEVSAIVARSTNGEMRAFPVAENTHREGILHTSRVPAQVPHAVAEQAQAITLQLAEALDVVGLLTVEFFALEDGTLLANEMAPRPHNSGHWT
ncbi:MAG: ATP-grasp domain-containing protein, partial [Rickettsiales bacterium]|nr:ATP-grasp domain-containing protein [Rickettsiales bacterium]